MFRERIGTELDDVSEGLLKEENQIGRKISQMIKEGKIDANKM